MKKVFLLLFICCFAGAPSFAQQEKMTREDKQEKNEAREARINKKNDYAIFRRQMLGLKELADERKRIPNLQKANKGMVVKVTAFIDSNDNDDDVASKTLIGYIRQDVGDNSTNMYEVIYDRAAKKIMSVKRTAEAADADREEKEDKDDKLSDGKPGTKKMAPKKSKDEEDDDPDEEKPSKTRHKEKDDD